MKFKLLEYFQPEPSVVLSERYCLVEKIGTNGLEQSFLAKDLHAPGHPDCIVRQFHLPEAIALSSAEQMEAIRGLFQSEVEKFSQLSPHVCVPQMLAHLELDGSFYFVEEKIEGHTLAEELASPVPWSDQRVVALLNDLLGTLESLHQNRIMHLNLQPTTLIRRHKDNRLALVGFGAFQQAIARIVAPGPGISTPPAFNTSLYMPDEQVAGYPQPCSDIYALGLIAVQALTGQRLETIPSHPQTGEFYWQSLVSLRHPALRTLLDYLVRYNFRTRCQNASEALAALSALPPEITWFAPASAAADLAVKSSTPLVSPTQEDAAPAMKASAAKASAAAVGEATVSEAIVSEAAVSKEDKTVGEAIALAALKQPSSSRKPAFQKAVLTVGTAIVTLLGASAVVIWLFPGKLPMAGGDRAETSRPDTVGRLPEQPQTERSNSDRLAAEGDLSAGSSDRPDSPSSDDSKESSGDESATIAAVGEDTGVQGRIDSATALAPEAAEATVNRFYDFVSSRSWDSARSLLSEQMAAQLEPDFFAQFQDVSVENMRVVSQTPEVADLVVQNTYVYLDGSYQQEERNYRVKLVDSRPMIVDTAFIEVIRDRNY